MRLHRTHHVLAPWSVGTPLAAADALVAVRVEPVTRQRRPALALDLVLERGPDLTVVPNVLVEPEALADRDRDPFVFPAGTPGGDAFAVAMQDAIVPLLEPLALAGAAIAEHVLRFAPSARFDAAREAGAYGAAPLAASLPGLAVYRYARRFARTRSVRIDAAGGAGGVAMLRDCARARIAQRRVHDPSAAWYGVPPVAAERCEVAVVDADGDPGDADVVLRLDAASPSAVVVAAPVPLDVTISFDAREAPPQRSFAVEVAAQPPRRRVAQRAYAATGGSSGRIAVLPGRPDAREVPDADLDEARSLVEGLCAEGFAAELTVDLRSLTAADLVHVVGLGDPHFVRAAVDAARRARVPVALHAHYEESDRGGWWGTLAGRFCFEYGSEERDVRTYLEMLARRAVAVGDARADAPYVPSPPALQAAHAALRDASIVFAADDGEAEAIVTRSGRRGPVAVVAPLAPWTPACSVAAQVGSDPFALVHAPFEARSNLLLVARVAAEARMPLVVTGPVVDASYLERVREFGGPDLVLLAAEPEPGIAAGLREAAAVAVDAAWIGAGSARSAAAGLAGARVVVAAARRLAVPGLAVRRCDPADAASLARTLGEAWDDALRAPARVAPETSAALAPAAVVASIVRGYAQLAAPA